jgi:hypothetical protein
MTHTITYDPAIHVIAVQVHGPVWPHEFREIFSEATRLAQQTDCFRFFTDYRDATIHLSTFDMYDLPQMLSDIALPQHLDVQRFKRAVVVGKDFTDQEFSEAVMHNRGHRVRFFADTDEAMQWLMTPP